MKRVYFIKPVGMDGPIKIGCTNNLQERFAGLSLFSPFPLEIMASLEGGHDIERRFHALFLAQRERGEWFTATRDLLACIAQVAAGTFDVSALPPPICLQPMSPRPSRRGSKCERVVHDENLLSDILAFCSAHAMTESAFGRMASCDPAMVGRLRQGRAPWRSTIDKVRQFMATYCPQQAAA